MNLGFHLVEKKMPPISLSADQVVAYQRKSTNEEGAAKSLQDQREVNFETAEEWGLPLTDDGIRPEKPGMGGNLYWEGYIRSGLKGDEAPTTRTRPILTSIMNDIIAGRVKCIVVWAQDRLWRSVGLCEVMIDILAQHACLLYDRNGPVDISTVEGRNKVMGNALASQHQREKAKVESPRGIQKSRARGKRVVTANVLGFRNVPGKRGELVHIEQEQEVVR